ncbi:hypothetical protein [uncultured Vagococcus sp.]|uniref:hypothetical protein n=1 Tax=uncultured Vagococcus sp. TaxID=189676 RepID=UPI0028D046EB|nr:hypothetical protein [uncultured Vagococcus sp.]
MFKKSKLVCVVASFILFVSPLVSFGNTIQAEEVASSKSEVVIVKNEKMKQLEQELALIKLKGQRSLKALNGDPILSQEETAALLAKYDGAETTVYVNRAAAYQSKLVNGGANFLATTKSGMSTLRSEMATTATLLKANGVVGGAVLGGLAGAILGFMASSVFADRCSSGSNDMKRWIDVGSSKGGVRMTLTEEFPISSIGSTSQAKIQKL